MSQPHTHSGRWPPRKEVHIDQICLRKLTALRARPSIPYSLRSRSRLILQPGDRQMATIPGFTAERPPKDKAEFVSAFPYDVGNTEEARTLAADNPRSFL